MYFILTLNRFRSAPAQLVLALGVEVNAVQLTPFTIFEFSFVVYSAGRTPSPL
jgi:hypothetical protein